MDKLHVAIDTPYIKEAHTFLKDVFFKHAPLPDTFVSPCLIEGNVIEFKSDKQEAVASRCFPTSHHDSFYIEFKFHRKCERYASKQFHAPLITISLLVGLKSKHSSLCVDVNSCM